MLYSVLENCEEKKKAFLWTVLLYYRTSIEGDFKDCIRLAFCHYDEKTLREAVIRLVQAIKFMQSKQWRINCLEKLFWIFESHYYNFLSPAPLGVLEDGGAGEEERDCFWQPAQAPDQPKHGGSLRAAAGQVQGSNEGSCRAQDGKKNFRS